MKHVLLGLLAASALGAATHAGAAEQDPDTAARRPALPLAGATSAVSNPDWVAKPTGDDVARFYPPIASTLAIAGRAVLQCTVSTLGMVENCKVSSETPQGLGFGQAAVSLSGLFRMKPKSIDGAPVGGAAVTIPIVFQTPTLTADPPQLDAPKVSAKTLALARRVAEAMGVADSMTRTYSQRLALLRQSEYAASSGAQAFNQEPALQALFDAAEAHRGAYVDLQAKIIAQQMPDGELAQVAAFLESPAGKDWISKSSTFAATAEGQYRSIFYDVIIDARDRFCKQAACLPQKAPAPVSASQGVKP